MRAGAAETLLVLVCLIGGTVAPRAARQTALESIPHLLDRYARAEGGLPRLASPQNFEYVRERLSKEAESWIRAGGGQTIRQRQLLAATLALELARASLDIDWGQGKQLIEWGSALLRKAPPDDAERLWHLAALSLIQGAFDNDLLVKQQKLAWPRFESESRFLLALVVRLEGDTWPDPDRGEPWDNNDVALQQAFDMNQARRASGQSALPELRAKAFEYQRRTRMRSAITLLEDLSNDAHIRPEVLLRLGFLHLRLQHSEIALEQFEDVLTRTTDPFLMYLAHFLSGIVHERAGDRGSAVTSYRAALAVMPRAQSASVALASLLFVGDRREEGSRLIDAAITPPVADDPWRTYQAGDFRHWSQRLIELRQAIQ